MHYAVSFETIAIATLVAIMSIGWVLYYFIYYATPTQVNNNSWTNESYVVKNYDSDEKAFNNQKQAIIDAYNAQIDKINIYGLKAKDDFHGLKFKTDVFKNSSEILKGTIHSDFDNSNVAAKIAKTKAFYDARINKIYDSLQKGQKVDFDGLKEYNTNNKIDNFNDKDFNLIGFKIENDSIENNHKGSSFFVGALLAMATAAVIFTIGMLVFFRP